MLKRLFGDSFDFNRDGKMDDFEKRAAFTTYLDIIRKEENIQKELSDMSNDELQDLVAKSGVDPSNFGY